MWLPIALSFLACSKEEPAIEEEDDPLVRAYGSCSGQMTLQEDGLSIGEGEQMWNEDGDLIEAIWDIDGQHSESTYTYGAIHERSRYTVKFRGKDPADYEWSYLWRDGQMAELSYDENIDGEIDYIETLERDERGLIVLHEWDYDGDGVTDDRLEITWESDGEGWHGEGQGIDPEGSYTAEFWTDSDATILRYRYDDDRSVHSEWEITAPNDLGISQHIEERSSQLGVYDWEQITDIALDDLGRAKLQTEQSTYAEAGGEPLITSTINTAEYSCP